MVRSSYDSVGRLLEEEQNRQVVGMSYVSDDRVMLRYPGANRIVFYGYDIRDRLTVISNHYLPHDFLFVSLCLRAFVDSLKRAGAGRNCDGRATP